MFDLSLALFAAALTTFLPAGTPVEPTAGGPDSLTTYVDCPLERIGAQLVRCDNLTGAGAAAPYWIPEQK
ncbi:MULTISPECIES: hypothetical protein [unclassified Arthrobacter]|uniref:hypothetical protein n=1 Tax=unclassified Arthrobacter TaxID=235627 RepID=UPI001C851A69|nr:hypothetical protein [Arthrobacter sp. MAHUQ-56]MBX7443848.1 hypothetical protein [Arthrobacter sp. MAHUQ-56]